ncbi:hypothetical protein XENOCAPTIV_012722 [Xenoophorus captivus]|uniref:Uncharacterized protein n=1 Tax=Xenoophorus captivus TaxID=1517983 RepID=A0ABV0R3K4_9TELE
MGNLELILEDLKGFRKENIEQLGMIKEEIAKVNNILSEAEERIGKLEDRILNTEEVLTDMLKLNIQLEDKLIELESRSRRENVRIYGVPGGQQSAEREQSPIPHALSSQIESIIQK